MANFLSNKWYELTLGNSDPRSMKSSEILYAENWTIGSVYFDTANTSSSLQQWQIFPTPGNASIYVLRSRSIGPEGYLSTAAGTTSDDGENAGNTVPVMHKYTILDDSVFWIIDTWGDGTFRMSNLENGTEWHLQKNPWGLGTSMSMSSNVTAPQDGQRFRFRELADINDVAFSTIQIPPSTALANAATSATSATSIITATASTSTSATSSPAAPPSSSENSGLSSGASAAIGATIGGVAILAIALAIFLFLRRRRRNAVNVPQYPSQLPHFRMEPETAQRAELPVPPAELYSDSTKYSNKVGVGELHSKTPVERGREWGDGGMEGR
ncbi:hypothetical protein H2201_002851 [Coniosporium apollinis]|uniref:Ricin B lectin domain-containing protein n=1 Tax=Coniosporium apollinis TaxID=61459 RepID=A0ABQ9NYH7_9PEZI|nr:hypothetical protein H2201_002851 [Coniosporium apollinis]